MKNSLREPLAEIQKVWFVWSVRAELGLRQMEMMFNLHIQKFKSITETRNTQYYLRPINVPQKGSASAELEGIECGRTAKTLHNNITYRK